MRLTILVRGLAATTLAADNKRPVITTKTKAQVGGLDRNGDGQITRTEYRLVERHPGKNLA